MEKLPELEPCSLSFGSPKKYMCVMDKLHNGLTHKQAAEVIRRAKAYEGLVKQVEAMKEVCEEYIPTEKMDEANDKVILICKGNLEKIGRDLLKYKAEQALQETEQ